MCIIADAMNRMMINAQRSILLCVKNPIIDKMPSSEESYLNTNLNDGKGCPFWTDQYTPTRYLLEYRQLARQLQI